MDWLEDFPELGFLDEDGSGPSSLFLMTLGNHQKDGKSIQSFGQVHYKMARFPCNIQPIFLGSNSYGNNSNSSWHQLDLGKLVFPHLKWLKS